MWTLRRKRTTTCCLTSLWFGRQEQNSCNTSEYSLQSCVGCQFNFKTRKIRSATCFERLWVPNFFSLSGLACQLWTCCLRNGDKQAIEKQQAHVSSVTSKLQKLSARVRLIIPASCVVLVSRKTSSVPQRSIQALEKKPSFRGTCMFKAIPKKLLAKIIWMAIDGNNITTSSTQMVNLSSTQKRTLVLLCKTQDGESKLN